MADPHPFHWQTAEYPDWNLQMLDHFLSRNVHGSRVYTIPAAPEELSALVADDNADAAEVMNAFACAVKKSLPKGQSFCSFCLDYDGWQPESSERPHFFGMLWFTCLLASGYPDHGGDVRERFRTIIGTYDHFQYGKDRRGCLSRLWEDFATWTRHHPGYAELILPPEDERLNIIGRSYYLAFPNRQDRQILADVLFSIELVGIEPPILPVVNALERARHRFSEDFQAALEYFITHFLHANRDPRDSAFWRTIRTEALYGLGAPIKESGAMTLIASWDDDETMLIRIVAGEGVVLDGATHERLTEPFEGFSQSLSDQSGDVDILVRKALAGEVCLSRGLASLIRQGVLLFQEDIGGEYFLASGAEIDGTNVALVREDRLEGFRKTFGGHSEESRFEGWFEIEKCKVRQLSEIPSGLEGVTQLLHTTSSPRPRLVGGIRVANGYLWIPMLRPTIRSPGASAVDLIIGNQKWSCERSGEEGDWSFPIGLQIDPPADVELRAVYEIDLNGHKFLRSGTTEFRFLQRGHGYDYKSIGSGPRYWREACNPEQLGQEGGEAVPLDIVTPNEGDSVDLLQVDPSARYLGPGLGEMSVERRATFQWLVTGTRKNPRDVVFIGDLDAAILPDGGESSHAGDRRAWAKAFASRQTRVTALTEGHYIGLAQEPRLQQLYKLFQRRARRELDVGELRSCAPSGIESSLQEKLRTARPSEQTSLVVEATAALGLARSGLSWREFQELIGRLTGEEDYHLSHQLIRAWAEAGFLDILRRQDQSQTMIVPRRPRFIMVRRGPTVDATLIGLGTPGVISAIEGVAGHSSAIFVEPTTEFQPAAYRLLNLESEKVAEISKAVGLDSPEWLRWPANDTTPGYLSVGTNIRGFTHGAAPDAYGFDGKWDWQSMAFKHSAQNGQHELVEVERRRHPQRCSIYVVKVDGEDMIWCFFRSWALLRAAELRETPPFVISNDAVLRSTGVSPVHLPLPFGRLCSVLGGGLPGQEMDEMGRVNGYRYPFGTGLLAFFTTSNPFIVDKAN